MPFFSFDLNSPAKDSLYAGLVAAVDTRKVILDVPDDSLERISVGKLAVLPIPQPDAWLVGFHRPCRLQSPVRCAAGRRTRGGGRQGTLGACPTADLTQGNAVTITLVGAVQRSTDSAAGIAYRFTRSLVTVPGRACPLFCPSREGT